MEIEVLQRYGIVCRLETLAFVKKEIAFMLDGQMPKTKERILKRLDAVRDDLLHPIAQHGVDVHDSLQKSRFQSQNFWAVVFEDKRYAPGGRWAEEE